MTDFRALCVELTDALDKLNCSFNVPNQSGLVERASAALAEPEPPSLKVQALEAAQRFYANGHDDCSEDEVKDDFDTICRALESLTDNIA